MGLSLKDRVASFPEDARRRFIDSMSDQDAADLMASWQWEARPEQLEPEGDWFCWFIRAGRGFGKTRTASEFIINRILSGKYKRVALIGRTSADVRDVMIEGVSGILAIAELRGMKATYEPSKRRITFGNGAIATAFSAEEPNLLRGPEHDLGWLDELATFPFGQEHGSAYENFLMGLRLGKNPQYIVTTTPRPTPTIRKIQADKSTYVTIGSSLDNAANLSPQFISEIKQRYEGTRLYRQEILGEILEDVEGAFWNDSMFLHTTPDDVPQLDRIVLAVDPAVSTNGSKSDETAIAVTGRSGNDFYVLHSQAGRYGALEWATIVNDLYHEYDVDMIYAEKNMGGNLVVSNLQTVNPDLPIETIHAKQGKRTRAEPVSAMYEQGRVFHVGDHAALEEQMCSFPVASINDDRVDSLVYSVLALSENKPTKQPSRVYSFATFG